MFGKHYPFFRSFLSLSFSFPSSLLLPSPLQFVLSFIIPEKAFDFSKKINCFEIKCQELERNVWLKRQVKGEGGVINR